MSITSSKIKVGLWKLAMNYHIFKHELGWIGISFSDIGLTKIVVPTQTLDQCVAQLEINPTSDRFINDNVEKFLSEFEDYLNGIPTSFDKITLDISDKTPDFYRAALMKCIEIPYGETLSYKQIAEKMGKPRSARAIGLAMARNPLPIIIPCHRVVRSDGGLGGYGGTNSNTSIKQLFLDIEKAEYLR